MELGGAPGFCAIEAAGKVHEAHAGLAGFLEDSLRFLLPFGVVLELLGDFKPFLVPGVQVVRPGDDGVAARFLGQEFLEQRPCGALGQPFPRERGLGQLSGARDGPQRDVIHPQRGAVAGGKGELAGRGDARGQEDLLEFGPLSRALTCGRRELEVLRLPRSARRRLA